MEQEKRKELLKLNPLKPNGKIKKLGKIIGLDTEDNGECTCTLLTLFSEKKVDTIMGQLKITDYMYSYLDRHREEKIDFFAHNMLYDLVNIFGAKNLLKDFELFFAKNNFIFAKYKKAKNLLFRDSFFLFPMKLAEMGKIIGKEKLESDDFQNVDYNIRDAEIVFDSVTEYHKVCNENNYDFAFTNGGIALKAFRRHYLKETYFLKSDIIPELRKAYYGGRCENFVLGERKGVKVYDVNSLYPFAMLNEFPDTRNYIKSTKLNPLGIYHVKVKIHKNVKIPLLPCRTQKENRLLFPVGQFETHVTGAELIAADQAGEIEQLEIVDGFIFANAGRIFENFVNDFYKMRKLATNKIYNQVYKNILNSLYGKFAQDNHRIVYNEKLEKFEQIETEYSDNSLFPWAIFVTAYSRIHVHKLLNQTDYSGIYYSDTDSIHTISRYKTGGNLGELKLEGEFSLANYQAPKQYFLLDKESEKAYYKIKGVPKDQREEFFNEGKVKFKKPVKLRESLRRNLPANLWQFTEKSFKNLSQKRQFTARGKSKPMEL